MRLPTAAVTGSLVSLTALATQAQGTNGSACTLFNPVPADPLRPWSAEASDGFTDARTLDAGHFQAESELLDYYHYHSRKTTVNQFAWAPRFTVGLLNFTPNLQLFAGIGFGLNTSGDLYHPRLGFVWRF